ncbi:hypothetical protein LTR37_008340 [Vermiconidia calcicola]|uniref:Uncharacterized protein n=1 Tax=Vermiconidia calcicola TaxID=1690605 RepID=A0ACC3NAT6_9PEZI|nr:hypothetical protein LTR37_008340 [Vermiconidia calcicola]
MALVKGGFQRLLQTLLYGLLFLCAAIILGIYSYFLSVLADRNLRIPTWEKAVEGISGAAVLYLICAVVLTCILGGVSFFAFLAIVLDVLFFAGMIAIAVMTRDGADSCKGNVQTPLGNGAASQDNNFGTNGFGGDQGENITNSAHLGLACRLNTVVFAVAIIAALLFLVTAAMQVLLVRHHKKEKRYGPSPSNNYTSGYGSKRKFGFGRKKAATGTTTKDPEAGNGEMAPVQDTPYHNTHTHNAHSGYYTAPTGTAASNPYGYNSGNTNTATNY